MQGRTLAYDHNGNVLCAGDGRLNVTYDPYNLPTEVRRSGTVQQFGYGPDLQRFVQQADDKTTIYLDRSYEQVRGGTARFQIDEDVLVRIEPGSAPQVHYQHRNRLGSIIAVTDGTGQLLADTERGYDPWGRPRDADWQGVDQLPGADVTPRGFTDHEHIDGSRLIHMNGRAFDPLLGRFLSVDPVIQFPANSQSLNPYSYIMNNPMAGTDPTGFVGVSPDRGCGTGTRVNISCGARGVETIGVNTGGSLTAGPSLDNGISSNPNVKQGIAAGIKALEEIGDLSERLNEAPITAAKRGRVFAEIDEKLASTDGAIFTRFFAAATAVNSTASLGSIDPGAIGDGFNELNESTESVLNALGRFLFVFNTANANRLIAGQEISGLEGLRGSGLDQALVGFEQTLVGSFLGNFETDPVLSSFVESNLADFSAINGQIGPDPFITRQCCSSIPTRQQVIDDVNSAFNGPFTRFKIANGGGITGRAFLDSVGAGRFLGTGGSQSDFGRFESRVGIGLNLVDQIDR